MKILDNWTRQEDTMKYSNATFSVGGKCCAGCDQRDVWLAQRDLLLLQREKHIEELEAYIEELELEAELSQV